jgi:hypothetical protein
MGVPPDKLMEMMRSQQGGAGGAPGGEGGPTSSAGAMSDASGAPSAGPMSTPENKMGSKEAARINLSMALDLLEQSLPALGSESEEGQKVMAALKTIHAVLGPRKSKTNELQQSEILQMMQQLPQAGGQSPEVKAMMGGGGAPGMPPAGGAPQPMQG